MVVLKFDGARSVLPIVAVPDFDTTLEESERRRMGAWYTPMALVDHIIAETIGVVARGATVSIVDPACGDGRFLRRAAQYVRHRGGVPKLTGVDIDLSGLRSNAATSLDEPIEAIEADALRYDWGSRCFDVVVGNPPFLSQMASATNRPGGSEFGGGTYADAAADFLALAVRLAEPTRGRVGLVLPVSLLTTRDAGPIRGAIARRAAHSWFWWSPRSVFEASVRTCAVGLQRGHSLRQVPRTEGINFEVLDAVAPPLVATENDHWGWLISDSLGVPAVPQLRCAGLLADHALVTANFRDQYYGLVGAVSDNAVGPPLITTGLIDSARCHWGARPTRFAKETFVSPRVDRRNLAPFMQRWVDRCLVPKVLVATQTRVIEAVADVQGEWLPAVPVIRVVPQRRGDIWSVAALLTSPVASAVIAGQSVGSGLSVATVRVSQRTLGLLPWPHAGLTEAVASLQAGDIETCGRLVDAAFGVADEELLNWWWRGIERQR